MIMKTKYFYSLAAMAMLTACTSSEEFEASTSNGKQKVEFADPFVGKGLTKASGDITTDGANNTSALSKYKVKVWGQEVDEPTPGEDITAINGKPANYQDEAPFKDGDVINWKEGSEGTQGAWTCTNEYYYPRDKYYFRFAAFAPEEAINTVESGDPNGVVLNMKSGTGTLTFTGDGTNNYGITNIPLVQEISNTENDKKGWDLLVSNRVLSTPTTGASDRTPISFTFQHILSRLSFYVYTISNTPTTVKVTNITAYLPKSGTGAGTACYNQNTNTANPTAETQKNDNTGEAANNNYNSKNSTWDSNKHDTWKWTFGAFTDIIVSTPSEFKSRISDVLSTTTYDKYEVYKTEGESVGETVSYYDSFNSAITASTPLTNIGSEFFLAPTPTNETSEDKVAKYHFYVTVNYTVTEGSDNKSYYAVLPLYESDFYRFKQGWHHKLYLNLSSKKIRFISASVDGWENHNEDMTVSREVNGWVAEQN